MILIYEPGRKKDALVYLSAGDTKQYSKYADVIRCLRVLSHLDSPEIENLKTITKTFTNCCGMYEARAVQK